MGTALSNFNFSQNTLLDRYLMEVRQYQLLTREQERELAIKVYEHDDPDAAYALATANLRLVLKIALEFNRKWNSDLLDLIQEGNVGLMQAVKKYDPYKEVKFSYYASFWIKAYMIKYVMDNWSMVKIGTTEAQRKLFYHLKREKQKLLEQGFDPNPKLLSVKLGVNEKDIIAMDQRLNGHDVSLDEPVTEDEKINKIDIVDIKTDTIEDQFGKKELEVIVMEKLNDFKLGLNKRELELFEERLMADNPITLQEFGDRYHISRERARQIESKIIYKTQQFFKKELPDYELIAA